MGNIMNLIIMDAHLSQDGRINKHIKYLLDSGRDLKVYHVNINFTESLPAGYFSYHGEIGYRINTPAYYKTPVMNLLRLIYCHFKIQKDIFFAFKTLNVNSKEPTIFHLHDPYILSFMTNYILRNFRKYKIIYDRHEVYENYPHIFKILPSFERLYEMLNKNIIHSVVTVSDEYIDPVSSLFPKATVISVPNYPYSVSYYQKFIENKIKSFNRSSQLNFMYIGSLNNKFDRDIDLLILIAENILKFNNCTNFYVGGSTDDPYLLNEFKSLSERFDGRFHYMGYTSREKVVEITQNAHFGFLLVKSDTLYWVKTSPNKVFEYLMCGVIPIVRANIEKSQEIDCCSLIFNRFSSENEIIKKILELIKSPETIKTYMENSAKLSTHFRWETVACRYLDLYYM
jgi:hypothetical protein